MLATSISESDKFWQEIFVESSTGCEPEIESHELEIEPHEVSLLDTIELSGENEIGDAELLSQMFRDKVIYDHSEKAWYIWSGTHWAKDRIRMVEGYLTGMLASQYLMAAATLSKEAAAKIEDKDEAESLRKQAKHLTNRAHNLRGIRRTKNVLEYLESRLPTPGDNWDSHPDLLATKYGDLIDLRTGRLIDIRPDYYIRQVVPHPFFGIGVPCPRWEQFLDEIWDGDKEVIGFMQRLLGYAITGHTTEHIFPILYGPQGRNGKDTLLSALNYVLGPSLSGPVSNDVLLMQGRGRSAGSAQPYLCDLQGKRLVWASETHDGARLDAAQIKLITGGNKIKTRPLYGSMVEIDPTHLLLLITNYRPHAPADDNALWERIILIPFDMRFVDNPDKPNERKKDAFLKETLYQEASGILGWLIKGCLEWRKQGLNIPEKLKLATKEYKQDEDSLGLFISECCIIKSDAKAPAGSLQARYKVWCEQMNQPSMIGGTFLQKMIERGRDLGFERKVTKTGKIWTGLGLLEES